MGIILRRMQSIAHRRRVVRYLSGWPQAVQKRVPAGLVLPQTRQCIPATPARRLWPQVVQKRLMPWLMARQAGQVT